MMSRTPKKKCEDCPANAALPDIDAKKRNLMAAYDAVKESQKVLACAAGEPGKYTQVAISTLYGMAVQGLGMLRDIEQCATENGIPLAGLDMTKAVEEQKGYVSTFRKMAETDDDI